MGMLKEPPGEVINGVNIDALKVTCEGIKMDSELGQSQFRIRNQWNNGGNNKIEILGFYAAGQEEKHAAPYNFIADEPIVLLGTDKGANPVEYLLTALSSCMTTSIVYHAAARGFQIESLQSEFEGDIDLRGFLGLSPDIPKGYQNIRATFTIKTSASERDIEEFYHFSPVYDMLSQAVPIQVKIVKEG